MTEAQKAVPVPTVAFKVVRPADLDSVRPLVHDFLLSALEHSNGESTIFDLYSMVNDGIYTLWVGIKDNKVVAAGMSYLVEYPRFTAIEIAYYADKLGDTTGWKQFMQAIEELAEEADYKRVQVVGRKGLLKILAPYDYKQDYIKMGKWI